MLCSSKSPLEKGRQTQKICPPRQVKEKKNTLGLTKRGNSNVLAHGLVMGQIGEVELGLAKKIEQTQAIVAGAVLLDIEDQKKAEGVGRKVTKY